MDPVAINQAQVAPTQRGYQVAKRILDICFCLFMIPILSPLLALLGILVALNSPGPVFFAQERIGKGGRPFRMFKFRTMPQDVEDAGHKEFMQAFVRGEVDSSSVEKAVYKPPQPLQATPLARLLRKRSLDELPQLFNVLRGEMSLVGPRPNVPWEVEAYLPWHHRRLEVLPGMTGLAQVRGRSGISFDTIVRYDIEYIEKQSLLLDLKIILWTVPCLISAKGVG